MNRMILGGCLVLLAMTAFATSHFHGEYTGPWEWDDLTYKVTTSGSAGNTVTRYDCTIAITGYSGSPTDLVIPSEIEWHTDIQGDGLSMRYVYHHDVVAIGDGAFDAWNHGSRCSNLESVKIPSSVIKIGGDAFRNCPKLKTIVIPSSVIEIGPAAFDRCPNLKSIVIPNSVTKIGNACFYACTSLTSVTLSNQISIIPESCFSGCSSLTDVTIPNSVTEIGQSCFGSCSSLSDVIIPNSVKEIGGSAFKGTAITSVYLGPNCTSLGNSAFSYCENLRVVTIENVSQINYYHFRGSPNIEELVFGNGVRDIDTQAFSYSSELSNLRVLKFGNNIENIGTSAFSQAGSGLNTPYMSIIIPPSVKSIGNSAFAYMYNVTNLVIQGVPKVSYQQFRDMTNLVSLTFGPGVQEIEDGFSSAHFYNMKKVCFESDDMKRIGDHAFQSSSSSGDWHCKKLEEVILPSSLESIGDSAFYQCNALKDIHVRGSSYTIPMSVKEIGPFVFESCASITNVVLEPGLTVLGRFMFRYCTGIKEIVIPMSVETIESSPFSGCTALSRIELEEGLQTLGESMFAGTAISEIFVPKSITQMGKSCFSGCKNLKDIVLEDGLPLVGESMFNACTLLQKMSIPSSVKQIGPTAFSGCTGLTTVNLSEGLNSIGQSAFQGCVGLRAMSFPESLNAIGNTAFSGCTSLSTISFPSGVSEVGIGAFSGCSVKSMLFNNANGEFLDQFSKESLRTLFLGKSADGITGGLLSDCSALETIMTAAANPNYSVDDCGVLFDKDKTKLIKYPCAASHQSYTAPETVKSVDDGAFAFASALQDIDFPASLTTVGEAAFDWCLGLGSVSFPATLRTIGTGAFTTCPSLEDLFFEGNAPTIGDNQFWYSSPVFHVQENTTGWDAVAERFDVEVVIGEGSGGGDSPALTMDWLAQYPTLWSAAGGDLTTAAKMTAANGLTLEECYIAGLDPTDSDSKFEARIDIIDGQPVVTWKPQLDKADAALRTYTTYGCNELGGDWVDFDAATPEIKATLRFFKVCVDMK